MRRMFTGLRTSIRLVGKAVPGAEDRQRLIPGFDQEAYSKASVVCVGAGGIISNIAPTLCRKGIGKITLLDRDMVEPSNLNRQRFYPRDIGKNKAICLARNVQGECIVETEIIGHARYLEHAIERGLDLRCNVAVCGVDNNPARVTTARFFRSLRVPVIFAAVSHAGDHGYVFVQETEGACIGCLFPDIVGDDRYPCPGTPAIADILQVVGALAIYAIDTPLLSRTRAWNYRSINLTSGQFDSSRNTQARTSCPV